MPLGLTVWAVLVSKALAYAGVIDQQARPQTVRRTYPTVRDAVAALAPEPPAEGDAGRV